MQDDNDDNVLVAGQPSASDVQPLASTEQVSTCKTALVEDSAQPVSASLGKLVGLADLSSDRNHVWVGEQSLIFHLAHNWPFCR